MFVNRRNLIIIQSSEWPDDDVNIVVDPVSVPRLPRSHASGGRVRRTVGKRFRNGCRRVECPTASTDASWKGYRLGIG